jgi:hypothetical protein
MAARENRARALVQLRAGIYLAMLQWARALNGCPRSGDLAVPVLRLVNAVPIDRAIAARGMRGRALAQLRVSPSCAQCYSGNV